jgi:two-component system sensor histidine kinase UhpB
MSLFWRVFALNAGVFVLAAVLLLLSPATVSSPVAAAEAAVISGGVLALVLVNLVLLRRSFKPLGRLTSLMTRVDLLEPGGRIDVAGPPEVRALVASFNDMLDRLESERSDAAGRMLAAQEAERHRVAQELHDEIGQSLTAVVLQLNRLAGLVPPELHEAVDEARETARASLDQAREIATRLRPVALDDLGLVSALTALSARFEDGCGVAVTRRIDPELPAVEHTVELAVYRIAQESLTNVARHAGATAVDMTLAARNGSLRLSVADNGMGLDGSSPGQGIRGMRERAVLIRGELSLARNPSGGTTVTLTVPLK